MPTPNLFKSGNTITNGSLYRNQFTIGVDNSFDFGPTSATSFWNGITPALWTIYQNKASNGPSIIATGNDGRALNFLQSIGATGSTLANALAWVSFQSPNTLAVNRDYPSIVTSGLTFHIDSGYVPSYPQQGKNWLDLSSNNNNVVTSGVLTYDTANGGVLKLPTVTPSLSATATNVSATTYTYGAFVYLSSTAANLDTPIPSLIGTRQGASSTAGPSIWISGKTTSNPTIGFNNIIFTGVTNYNNSWRYFVGTQDATTQRFYVNGTLVSSATSLITSGSTDRILIGAGTSIVGGLQSSCITPLTGYTFHIYNRALSDAEVLANYNALKGRVGL